MILFLVYTQTRSAWIAVLFQVMGILCFLGWRSFRHKTSPLWNRNNTMAALAGMLLVMVFANLGPQGFTWQLSTIVKRAASALEPLSNRSPDPGTREMAIDSVSLRIAIWQNTLEMITQKPWAGVGLGNHKVFYPAFHTAVVKEMMFGEDFQLDHVHNDFLQLFAETGVPGVVAAMALFLSFSGVIAKLLASPEDSISLAAMGMGSAFLGILIDSCFSFPFEMPIPPLVLMLFFAIACGVSPETRTHVICLPPKTPALLLVPVIFLLMVSVPYYYRDIQCDRYFLQAKRLEVQGNWKGVALMADKAFELNPHKKKILSYSGRGYIESGEYQKGIDALLQVIQDYPFHMNALLNLGVAHSQLNQYEPARRYFQKVLEIKPDFPKAHMNMAGIYMNQNLYDQAIESFQKAAAVDSENPLIFYNMGLCQIYLKAYAQAALSLKKTVALKPDWATAHLNLAILYYQHLERQEESIPHFQKALELNPQVQNREEIQQLIELFSKP